MGRLSSQSLRTSVAEFTGRIAGLRPPTFASYRVSELRPLGRILPAEWRDRHGIYAFVDHDCVVYVGRAATDTLGQRIFDQLLDRGDPKWNIVRESPTAQVHTFAFEDDDDWVWVPSLEVYLIRAGSPRFNKRRC